MLKVKEDHSVPNEIMIGESTQMTPTMCVVVILIGLGLPQVLSILLNFGVELNSAYYGHFFGTIMVLGGLWGLWSANSYLIDCQRKIIIKKRGIFFPRSDVENLALQYDRVEICRNIIGNKDHRVLMYSVALVGKDTSKLYLSEKYLDARFLAEHIGRSTGLPLGDRSVNPYVLRKPEDLNKSFIELNRENELFQKAPERQDSFISKVAAQGNSVHIELGQTTTPITTIVSIGIMLFGFIGAAYKWYGMESFGQSKFGDIALMVMGALLGMLVLIMLIANRKNSHVIAVSPAGIVLKSSSGALRQASGYTATALEEILCQTEGRASTHNTILFRSDRKSHAITLSTLSAQEVEYLYVIIGRALLGVNQQLAAS